MQAEPKVLILANGLFPTAQESLDLLKAADLLICCDGAADKLIAKGMVPQVIVGDMDSVSDEVRKQYASIVIQSDDQENNDPPKAWN